MSSLVSTQHKLISTRINTVSNWQHLEETANCWLTAHCWLTANCLFSLPGDKKLSKSTLLSDSSRKMACWLSDAGLWLELTTNSLRQKSSLICLSTSFPLPCINPQALINTVSWNHWKSCQTWVWTWQDKFSGNCWHEATNILQLALMEWKRKASKLRPLLSLSTSCGLLGWLSKGLARIGQNAPLNQNSKAQQRFFSLLPVLCLNLWCLFDHGRLHLAWDWACNLRSDSPGISNLKGPFLS